MNIPVGTVSDAARAAIEAASGRIEETLKEGVVLAVLPDTAEIVWSNNAGALIQMGDNTTLYFKRGWYEKQCVLTLQSEL